MQEPCGLVQEKIHSFLNLALDRNEWLPPPWHFTARDRASGILLIKGWVGLRASLDVYVEEKNLLHLSRIERPFLSRSACSLVTILTMLP
jgi:hypothetical protein